MDFSTVVASMLFETPSFVSKFSDDLSVSALNSLVILFYTVVTIMIYSKRCVLRAFHLKEKLSAVSALRAKPPITADAPPPPTDHKIRRLSRRPRFLQYTESTRNLHNQMIKIFQTVASSLYSLLDPQSLASSLKDLSSAD